MKPPFVREVSRSDRGFFNYFLAFTRRGGLRAEAEGRTRRREPAEQTGTPLNASNQAGYGEVKFTCLKQIFTSSPALLLQQEKGDK